jgi:hypothetical protein
VLPCAAIHYHRLRENPLVMQLLGQVAVAGAQFLVSVEAYSFSSCDLLPLSATAPPLPLERISDYSGADLAAFTRLLAGDTRAH